MKTIKVTASVTHKLIIEGDVESFGFSSSTSADHMRRALLKSFKHNLLDIVTEGVPDPVTIAIEEVHS